MSQDELQAVRARVGSYFNTDKSIRDQAVVNAMCLSLAEVRMRTGITKIAVDASGDSISVTTDGPPLPTEKANKFFPDAETLFTELKACHKHPGHAGFEAAVCANGIAVVNAISSDARIITGAGSTAMVQKYSVGQPLGGFSEVKAKVNGTRLEFDLDKRWSGSDKFDLAAIELQVRSIGVALDGVALTFKDS